LKYIEFAKDNVRFVLALSANFIALILALYWMIDANFMSDDSDIELEPIVTSIALGATLLGLNYVNDKLTRPDIRFHLSMAMALSPEGKRMDGISVEIMNHSIQKLFISSFSIEIKNENKRVAIARNGFSREIISKPVLEPGQAFSLNIDKETVLKCGLTQENTGDFVVQDQVGRSYRTPVLSMAKHVKTLLEHT
tara:strand:- start:755 stop:1339 length:585 start_codon:yes stop_codon:yes gene_type:complete